MDKEVEHPIKRRGKDMVSGLFRQTRDNYRTPSQIRTDGGKLTDFTLVLLEETLKVISNRDARDGLVLFSTVQALQKRNVLVCWANEVSDNE